MSSKNDRGRPLPPSLPPFLPSVWPRVSLSVRQCSSWSFPPLAPSSSSLNQTLVYRRRNCLPACSPQFSWSCPTQHIGSRLEMPVALGIRAKPREAGEATLITLCVLYTLEMFWLLCLAHSRKVSLYLSGNFSLSVLHPQWKCIVQQVQVHFIAVTISSPT